MSKLHTLQVRTPEGILFAQQLAGPVTRFLAWGIDLVCISLVLSVLSVVAGLLGVISAGLGQAVALLLWFSVSLGYGCALEWFWRGQTVGKRMLRLRVVDAQGLKLHFSQVAVRNLLRAVDMLPGPYLVGGVACVLSRRAQRLGDFAANTVVIRHPTLAHPDLDQLLAGKYNSLRAYPHLEARLRQQVSPAEAALALQAIVRRDALEPQARVELFAQIAGYFQTKVRFPPEAVDGLTDEQYVRNAVDVIYRPRTPSGSSGTTRQ